MGHLITRKGLIKIGIVKGLGNIEDFNKDNERQKAARKAAKSGPKTEWFNLKKAGDTMKVRFLQELDADSPNYSEKNDLGFIAVMHQGPGDNGWKRKAMCTADEGDCYPCEQYKAFAEGWPRANSLLYINVLENPGTDEERVSVLSQGMSAKQITPTLLSYARDTGSITNREWRITRNGEGTDTSYTLTAFDKQDFEKGVEDYEIFDLETVPRKVDYDDQPEFFGAVNAEAKQDASSATPEKKASDFVSW